MYMRSEVTWYLHLRSLRSKVKLHRQLLLTVTVLLTVTFILAVKLHSTHICAVEFYNTSGCAVQLRSIYGCAVILGGTSNVMLNYFRITL